MRKTLSITILLCLCSIQIHSQNVNGIEITKELICRGAAVSVVGNVKPMYDLNFTKRKILELNKDLVKEPIKDSPSKAYDLFKANKTKTEVTEILYTDFMKLDEKITSEFLINSDPEDY
tara:strand:- start:43199 stop:43555 length:357 start_codon:yes stop_codon:yes gene_type:complete